MPTHDVRAVSDVHVTSGAPNSNHSESRWLGVRAGDGIQRAYIHIPHGVEPGLQVASAKFYVYLRDGWSGGPHDLTVRRVTGKWGESTLTYNTEPAVATNDSVTVNITDGQPGQEVEFDITTMVANVAAGAEWRGLRLGTTSAGPVRRIHSSESDDPDLRPRLIVEYFSRPQSPVDLDPSGGLRTNRQKPTLRWRFRDKDGDEQAEFQVQVSTSTNFSSPLWDSGWVVSDEEQCDLAETDYPGDSPGDTRYWRVRTKDVNGLISPWSEVESYTRTVKGTFSIISPVDEGTVDDATATIITKLESRNQEAIAYRLEEKDPATNKWVEVWNKPRHAAPADAGDEYSFDIPQGRIKRINRDYRLRVRSWDVVDRVWDGDPIYYQDFATFRFVRSATPLPVTDLTVEQGGPGVKLTFSRGEGVAAPDYFCLVVDGERIFSRIDPANIVVDDQADPLVYSFVWYGAQPRVAAEYEIEAVVQDNGRFKHSEDNVTRTFTSRPSGIWIIDDEDPPYRPANPPRMFRLVGSHESAPQFEQRRQAGVFEVVGRKDPVQIVSSVGGSTVTISGLIRGQDPEGEGFIRTAKWAASEQNVGRRFRLIVGPESIPVEIAAMSFAPQSHPGERLYQVDMELMQVGEFREFF